MGGIGYITAIGANIMTNSSRINLNVLEAARSTSDTLEGYFYSSSACVYPEGKQLTPDVIPLKESDAIPAEPDQFYGWEKLFSEKLCEAYTKDYNLPIKVGRYHNIYGPIFTAFDEDKGKAPCHTIYKVISCENGIVVVWGDGRQTRSFMYIDDCVEATLGLMDTNRTSPLNIGTDELICMDDLTEMVISFSGKDILINYDGSKPQGVRGRNADLTDFEEVLGFRPRYTLRDGMLLTYDWALENWEGIVAHRQRFS